MHHIFSDSWHENYPVTLFSVNSMHFFHKKPSRHVMYSWCKTTTLKISFPFLFDASHAPLYSHPVLERGAQFRIPRIHAFWETGAGHSLRAVTFLLVFVSPSATSSADISYCSTGLFCVYVNVSTWQYLRVSCSFLDSWNAWAHLAISISKVMSERLLLEIFR